MPFFTAIFDKLKLYIIKSDRFCYYSTFYDKNYV